MVRGSRNAIFCKTYQKSKDYGSYDIKFVSETTLNKKIRNTTKQHNFPVVQNNVTIVWTYCPNDQSTSSKQFAMEGLLIKFNKFLSPSYKCDENHDVKITVDDDCKPFYYSPRNVPFRWSFDRLDNSEWACSVVSVYKAT